MKKFRTHYDNLQVSQLASDIVIRAAFRGLSQKYHPDKNLDDVQNSERVMKIINEAYTVLSNPKSRKEHDEWIKLNINLYSEPQPKQTKKTKEAKEAREAREAREASNEFNDYSESSNRKTNKHEFDFEPKNRSKANYSNAGRSNKTRSIFDDIEAETVKETNHNNEVVDAINPAMALPVSIIIGSLLLGYYLYFKETVDDVTQLRPEPSASAQQTQYDISRASSEPLQYEIPENYIIESKPESKTTDSQSNSEALEIDNLLKKHLSLMIENTLTFNEKTQTYLVDGSKVINALATEGFISSEPTFYYRQNNYYLINAEIEVLGSKLLLFNHQNLEDQMVCCTNKESGVLLLIKENSYAIEKFSNDNKCKLQIGNSINLPNQLWQAINEKNKSFLALLTCEGVYRTENNANLTEISSNQSVEPLDISKQVQPIERNTKILPDNLKQNQKNCTQVEVALNQC